MSTDEALNKLHRRYCRQADGAADALTAWQEYVKGQQPAA